MSENNKIAFSHIGSMSLRTWEKLLARYGKIIVTWGQSKEVVAIIMPPPEDAPEQTDCKDDK